MVLLNLRETNERNGRNQEKSKNIYSMQGSIKNKTMKTKANLDFSLISKQRLDEFRLVLTRFGLISDEELDMNRGNSYDNLGFSRGNVKLSNASKPYINKKILNFLIQPSELSLILNYLSTFYFPLIRLYYHFLNIEQITENKKIEIVVCQPSTVPNLSEAVIQIQERHEFDEKDEENEEENEENEGESFKFTGNNEENLDLKQEIVDSEGRSQGNVGNQGKKSSFKRGNERRESLITKSKAVDYERKVVLKEVESLLDSKIESIIGDVEKVMSIKEKVVKDKVLFRIEEESRIKKK
jgi:hypothetical protein